MADARTELASGVDGHRAILLVTINFIRKLAATYKDIASVALVFEASERSNELVKRDVHLSALQLADAHGEPIPVPGYFISKSMLEPGLQIADLVAHTAGWQRRHQLRGNGGALPDFQQMFWHIPIPPGFMLIDMIEVAALAVEDGQVQQR